jgi:hypothetical protein
VAGGRGEAEFRAEMRAHEVELERAAREVSGEFLRSKMGGVDWFVTLTFDRRPGRQVVAGPSGLRTVVAEGSPAVLPVVSPERALRAAGWWRRSLGRAVARHVTLLAAVEPHKSDGSSHVHGLVHFSDGVPRDAFQVGYFMWFRRYGYCRILLPKSEANVCDYCGKYVMKGSGEWRLIGVRS